MKKIKKDCRYLVFVSEGLYTDDIAGPTRAKEIAGPPSISFLRLTTTDAVMILNLDN